MLNTAKVIGKEWDFVKERIIVRCDCGGELMEITQEDPIRDYEPLEYVFKWYGLCGSGYDWKEQGISVEDISAGSAFTTSRAGVQELINFFTSDPAINKESTEYEEVSIFLKDNTTKNRLECVIDNFGLKSFRLLTPKDKCLWEIVLRDAEVVSLMAALTVMINNDKQEETDG